MPNSHPIRTHLPNVSRDAIVADLQATLSELIDLSLKGKQLHWNLFGPRFRSIHELLDELVASHREHADTIAERCSALGVAPIGSAGEVSAQTPLAPLPKGYIRDDVAVQMTVSNLERVTARVRKRIERMGELDPVSQDLMIALAADLEKQSWMFQASVPPDVREQRHVTTTHDTASEPTTHA